MALGIMVDIPQAWHDYCHCLLALCLRSHRAWRAPHYLACPMALWLRGLKALVWSLALLGLSFSIVIKKPHGLACFLKLLCMPLGLVLDMLQRLGIPLSIVLDMPQSLTLV